jgi:hypothetical protein
MSRFVTLAVSIVLLSACAKPSGGSGSSDPAMPSTSSDRGTDPTTGARRVDRSAQLRILEEELMNATFVMRFDVEATGLVQARLIGELRTQEQTLRLAARGSFGGNPVELSLRADGHRLQASNGTAKLDVTQPVALRQAVMLGMIRMGILHNLALLVSVRAPEHAEGGIDDWVRVQDVVAGASVGADAPSSAARQPNLEAMSFAILVADQPAGEATLWWGVAQKLPVERHQIVRFPEGEMYVRETYSFQPGPAS